ncbi:hypothetical protein C0989_007392 [Termitomyces sp. Mn162]|nr:hypothetical protein C0989_007392 [Termitomyces sp. Mn162]
MVGSSMEWAELVVVNKECWQLYEKHKEEEWIREFNKYFAPLPSSLEFLMEDLEAGMTHPPCELAMTTGVECSEGHGGVISTNHGDIGVARPSTLNHAVGSIAKGLAMLPLLATTPKGKGKGKAKARKEEEDEGIEKPIEDSFTDKWLATLLHWQKALTVVDMEMGD